MAITFPFEGAATIGATEWSLTTSTSGPDVETSDGCFQVFLDLSALANGDEFEFRIYEKVNTASDTQRVCQYATFRDAQGTDGAVAISIAPILGNGWDMTLKKTAGTDRAIGWSIRKAA